jgi:hypothetical protein
MNRHHELDCRPHQQQFRGGGGGGGFNSFDGKKAFFDNQSRGARQSAVLHILSIGYSCDFLTLTFFSFFPLSL